MNFGKRNTTKLLIVLFVTTLMLIPISEPIFCKNFQHIEITTTPIYEKVSTTDLPPLADGEIIEPDSLQSPIRKYFTTQKILWTFDDYWINEDHCPPHKGYGGLSEQIHTYEGYVGIMAPFIPSWIGQKFGNQISNYSVVDEFSVYTSRFSQTYVNKSLEFFNRSYIEPECHGWNHSEDLNHATLSYAYQIINYTLWNWYNNYNIKPKFWLGHNYDGNYNISLALKKFSETYWTVYAEYFTINSEELFPNHIEPAVEYIGLFFDPYFGCTYGYPCKTVQEAQQRFTSYAQNKEIVAIRGHPLFLNGSEPRATENLTKWQQFIDWVYQAHTYININHSQAIYYKVDRNNFTVEKNNDENYTIDLTNCQFDHTVLFTNPDQTDPRVWTVYDQTGDSIGIVSDDVFLPLKSGMKYCMVTDPGQEPDPSVWWNINWNYRREIILDHTQVSSTIANFPLLIKITDLALKLHVQPTGYDIVFTDTNGIKLNHEIETYRSSTGELTVWVNIPLLSSTQDTTLYIYYGNPTSEDQQNREATWDAGYLAVHHLEEQSGNAIDSTSHQNDGIVVGSPAQDAQGKINGAVLFDSPGDHFTLPQVYTTENKFTMEAWIYAQNGARYFISQRSGSSQGVFIQITGGNYLQYYINGVSDGKTITLNTWHHVVLTYDGSTAKLYVNGVSRNKLCASPIWPSQAMYLGDSSSGTRQFYGTIDEIRFSNIARSSSWITTCYNNQNNPASFSSVGPEEVTTGEDHPPVISNEQPVNGAMNVPVSLSELRFILSDADDDPIAYTVTASPDIIGGVHSGNDISSGTTITIPITTTPLSYGTSYIWQVSATDGAFWTNTTFGFSTSQETTNDWPYRKQITIDHTKVSSTLTQFPLLLKITDTDLATKAQENGDDIYFTDNTDVKLPHELEKYNSATGELVCWINIPSLLANTDTILYMYYGNPDAENQENVQQVWDSQFLAVHHLEESSGIVLDSTAHNNDGIPYGSLNQNVEGRIDGADAFDGVDDHITLPQVYTTENKFTMEAWIYAQNGARYFISQRSGSSQGVFIQITGGNYLQYYINGISDGKTITLNTWHHVVLTYDGSSAKLYVNGAVRSKSCGPPIWPSEGMYLGDRSSGNRQFYGLIDEVRFSNIARSNAWVTTSYTNQNNPSAFLTISPEES